MKLSFRPSLLKRRTTKALFVVLHHTSELYDQTEAFIDSPAFQLPYLVNGVMEQKTIDINYHFVVERVRDDFQVFSCMPLSYICKWTDIPKSINNGSIHIAVLGNYNVVMPLPRLYEVLAYRCINPLMKTLKLPVSRLKFHREISTDKELDCPGIFLKKHLLISQMRRFVIV